MNARLPEHWHGEPVAELGHGLDRIAAQNLAQAYDDVGEIGIGDVCIRPERVDQLVPAYQTFSVPHQQEQRVERLGRKRDRPGAMRQLSLGWKQLEVAEAVAPVPIDVIFL